MYHNLSYEYNSTPLYVSANLLTVMAVFSRQMSDVFLWVCSSYP